MGRRVVAWVVAAAVTGALVAGGVLVARGGRDRSPAVLPALDLGASGATGAATADAAAEPAPAGAGRAEPAAPSDSGVPGLWPRVTYRLRGSLPALPDQAQARRVEDEPGAGRVAALAAALGLRGRLREDPSGWTVRDGDRALTVHRLAGAPFTFGTGVFGTCAGRVGGGPSRPGGGVQCLDADAPVSNTPGAANGNAGAGSSGAGSGSRPGNPGTGVPAPSVATRPVAAARPFPPADLPGHQAAERVARDLAAGAGLDLAGASVRVGDAYAARLVTITPAVGGLPTSGFGWTVTVGAKDRIQHAGGYLAVPEAADTYPLIGVGEGFERLKRTPPIRPLLRAETPGAEPAIEPAVEPDPCPPGGKVPCAAEPLPARVATVTGVRLGLQLAPALPEGNRPADQAWLLPAYLFELEGGWTEVRSVIAVQDRYLTRP